MKGVKLNDVDYSEFIEFLEQNNITYSEDENKFSEIHGTVYVTVKTCIEKIDIELHFDEDGGSQLYFDSVFARKILVIGHADHGKTTASVLKNKVVDSRSNFKEESAIISTSFKRPSDLIRLDTSFFPEPMTAREVRKKRRQKRKASTICRCGSGKKFKKCCRRSY